MIVVMFVLVMGVLMNGYLLLDDVMDFMLVMRSWLDDEVIFDILNDFD